jgi:hypothetical protein
MHPEELQKNIALYYSKLSPNAQKVFSSMEWLQTLQIISTKYNLNVEQTQTLGTETTLVLLGIISSGEYEETLKKEIVLSVEYPERLITEIKDSILNTIQPELTEAFETNIKPQTPEGQKIEQELDERFDKLPESIKNIISESNYQTTLYDIAKSHGLNVIQMGTLEIIFIDLVTGVIHADKFEEALKNKLQLPNEKVHTLAENINEKILKEIRIKMVGLPDTEEENKENTKILSSAGIEILDEKEKETLPIPDLPAVPSAQLMQAGKLELSSSPRLVEEGAGGGDLKEQLHPILAQKLSGFTQEGVVETHHSLDNLTKSTEQSTAVSKVDPYREIPE